MQGRLNDLAYGPLDVDGVFGNDTREVVLRFQRQRGGLTVDGVVGAATWSQLFLDPGETTPRDTPPALLAETLKVASGEVGVRESGGPNRGPRVDEYLRNVGLDPTRGSYSWCASFVYFCFTRAAVNAGVRNPCVKTAGVLRHWEKSPAWARIDGQDAVAAPSVVRPGTIFIIDHGKGKGHTGLVERLSQSCVHTIEGNTNGSGSREGDGVYRRIRPLSAINVGFIDYGLPQQS